VALSGPSRQKIQKAEKEEKYMRAMCKTLLVAGGLFYCLLTAQVVRAATPLVSGPQDLEGNINGAPFRIRVPANWNGALLVYAHGYRDRADHPGEVDVRKVFITPAHGGGMDPAPNGLDVDARETFFLSLGYALAGSAYKSNGSAVKDGVRDTMAVVSAFRQRVGKPTRVILWGESLGGAVTARSVERNADAYDGAIPLCAAAPTVGSLGADFGVDFRLAYDVAFGWNPAWGMIADIRDQCESGVPGSGVDFETEVLPVLGAQLNNPANIGRFEFLRLGFSGLTPDEFYNQFGVFYSMYFNTEGLAESECRIGAAPLGGNLDHIYFLPDDAKAYLATLGVDANALLATMNAQRNIKASNKARSYQRDNLNVNGKIRRPVLTMHTLSDPVVPVIVESIYQSIVQAAGRGDHLVQVYTTGVGHCLFSDEQLVSVLDAMNSWLDTGIAPDPQDPAVFPPSQGFAPLP
jgi:pimeloyl-ACP methyl ester carboxylesterase